MNVADGKVVIASFFDLVNTTLSFIKSGESVLPTVTFGQLTETKCYAVKKNYQDYVVNTCMCCRSSIENCIFTDNTTIGPTNTASGSTANIISTDYDSFDSTFLVSTGIVTVCKLLFFGI